MTTTSAAEDAGLLRLAQWLSPAFPVGGFAWSHGLEAAVTEGAVADAAGLRAWLEQVLCRGAGRTDAALLVAAMAPGADHGAGHAALDALARALAPSRERLAESVEQGAAFTAATNALLGRDDAPAVLPVAVGRAAAGLDLAPPRVAALYLQSFAANIVLAGVRFIPLGQTAGQTVLADLHGTILDVARQAAETPPETVTSCVPGADLAAMAHETQPVRLFRS